MKSGDGKGLPRKGPMKSIGIRRGETEQVKSERHIDMQMESCETSINHSIVREFP